MKKLVAILLTLAMLSSLFVGCDKKDTETTKKDADTTNTSTQTDDKDKEEPVVEEAAPVELRIVTMFGGTDPATVVFEDQIKAFMEKYPNVTVTNQSMTSVGDEFRTSVKTDFSTGNEADITFFYTGADVQGIISEGKVVPYSEIWATYPEVGKDISAGILDTMKEADGEIYALPLTGFYEGMFVNKALFDQFGVTIPTNWDELLTAIDKFNENGIVPIAGPIAQSHYLIEHFILSQAGVAGHKDTLANGVPADWVQGLTNIKDLYDKKAFSEDALTMDIELAQNLFRQGQAAMILEGSWFIGGCDPALQETMTVIPFPTAPNGKKDPSDIIAGFSSGYYVSRKAYDDEAKQQAVVDLVSFLTTADAIKAIAQANGGTPSAKVVVDGLPQVAIDGHQMAASAVGLDMPIDSRLKPEAFNYIVKEGVPYIAYGERTAQEVLDEVKKIQDAQ